MPNQRLAIWELNAWSKHLQGLHKHTNQITHLATGPSRNTGHQEPALTVGQGRAPTYLVQVAAGTFGDFVHSDAHETQNFRPVTPTRRLQPLHHFNQWCSLLQTQLVPMGCSAVYATQPKQRMQLAGQVRICTRHLHDFQGVAQQQAQRSRVLCLVFFKPSPNRLPAVDDRLQGTTSLGHCKHATIHTHPPQGNWSKAHRGHRGDNGEVCNNIRGAQRTHRSSGPQRTQG